MFVLITLFFVFVFSCNFSILLAIQELVFPARPHCFYKNSYIDNHLKACVFVDHSTPVNPKAFVCSGLSNKKTIFCTKILNIKYCTRGYTLNEESQCIRATVYRPKNVTCSSGYTLKRKTENKVFQCSKNIYTDLYEQYYSNGLAIGTTYTCPPYSKMRTIDDKIFCSKRIIINPDSNKSCRRKYSWSSATQSCLKLSQQIFKNCEHGSQLEVCNKQDYRILICPPSWILHQRLGLCFKKKLSPILYDCKHTEGYQFKWDDDKSVGLCVHENSVPEFVNYKKTFPSKRENQKNVFLEKSINFKQFN